MVTEHFLVFLLPQWPAIGTWHSGFCVTSTGLVDASKVVTGLRLERLRMP